MTRILLVSLWLMSTTGTIFAAGMAPHTCEVHIHATGLRNEKGVVGASIFHSPDGWPEDNAKAFAQEAVPITGDQATIPLELPPGRYSIVVLHDENLNHKLDRNFLAMPNEGFGFANNPRVFLTAPSFEAANIAVTCPETDVQIRMIYK